MSKKDVTFLDMSFLDTLFSHQELPPKGDFLKCLLSIVDLTSHRNGVRLNGCKSGLVNSDTDLNW